MEAAGNEMVPVPDVEQTRVVYLDGQLLLVEADMRMGRPNIFRTFLRGSSVHTSGSSISGDKYGHTSFSITNTC